MMIPKQVPIEQLDVTAAIYEPTLSIKLEDELWLANMNVSEVSA